MVDSELDELLRYIITSWLVCAANYGRETSKVDPGSLTTQFLRALWRVRDQFVVGMPETHPDKAAGYVPDRHCVWLRRSRISRLSHDVVVKKRLKSMGRLFYDGEPFYKNHLRAWKKSNWWADAPMALHEIVYVDRIVDLLMKEFGVARDALFPWHGPVFPGVDKGIVWLGYRDDAKILDELRSGLAANERVKRLLAPLVPLTVIPYPAPRETPLWWKTVGETTDSIAKKFVEASRALMRDLGATPSMANDVDLLPAGKVDKVPAAIVVYLPDLSVEGVNAAVSNGRRHFRDGHAESLIVCVPAPFDDTQGVLQDPRIDTTGFARRKVLHIGLGELASHLSHRPWLWSQWCGGGWEFLFVRDDPASLLRVLVRDPRTQQVLTATGDELAHPSIQDASLADLGCVRLVGRPGSGKRVAVYHLLRRTAGDRLVVVLGPRCSAESWTLLQQVVDDLAPARVSGVVFVVEHLHFGLPVGERDTLTRLADVLPRLRERGVSACVVVTYWSSEQRAVLREYGTLFGAFGAGIVVNLDALPVSFLSRVAEGFRHYLTLPIGDAAVRELLVGARERDWPVGFFVGRLFEEGEPSTETLVALETRVEYAQRKYALLLSDGSREEVGLVWLLGALRVCGVKDVGVGVAELCGGFLGFGGLWFHRALSQLCLDGWVRVEGGVLHAETLQFGVCEEALLGGLRDVAGVVQRFLVWVAEHPEEIPSSLRQGVLYRGASLLYAVGCYDLAIWLLRAKFLVGTVAEPKDDLNLLLRLRRARDEGPAYLGDVRELVGVVADVGAIVGYVGVQLCAAPWFGEDGPWVGLWPAFEEWVFGGGSPFGRDVLREVLREVEHWGGGDIVVALRDRLVGAGRL